MNISSSQPIKKSTHVKTGLDAVDSSATGFSEALIVIQPITTLATDITGQVKQVSEITGLDNYTIRQKLTGSVMDILCSGSDIPRLEEITNRLSTAGYQAAFVRKSDLLGNNNDKRAVTARKETGADGAITFLDINGEEILQWSRTSRFLVVTGSLDPEQYGTSRNLMASLYGEDSNFITPPIERITDLSKQKPGLMIIDVLSSATMFVDATMFNYEFLGENLTLSLAQNYISLVKYLGGLDENSNTFINTDFGQKTLPLGPLASKPKTKPDVQNLFALYAKLVTLAHKHGFYVLEKAKLPKPSSKSASNPVLEIAETLTQASILGNDGALQPQTILQHDVSPIGQTTQVEKNKSIASSRSAQLPPPPDRPDSAYIESGLYNIVMHIQRFGPPAFVIGCIVLSIALVSMSMSPRTTFSLYWSFLPIGLAMFNASIVFARRKGEISRLPTSKLRSMPMGIVEVKGLAKRKYALKAPHSLVDCIYYNFRVLERTTQTLSSGAETENWRVIIRGDSGRIPFYIEDSTGKALVDPIGAIISGAQTNEYSSSFAEMISGAASQPNRRIVETVIPEGAELYILGFARPTAKAPQAQKEEYRQRLKALKTDSALMKQYDTDGDGDISFEEWAVAKADLDNQILKERIESDPLHENVVIGKHSGSGLFYISDKEESDILNSYTWKIPALGLVGFALLVKGLWELLMK